MPRFRRIRGTVRARAIAAGALAGALVCPATAHAESARPPRWHVFFGLDSADRSFFGHGGLVWAPRGHLHRSGWRLRAGVNGGWFDYRAGRKAITGQLTAAEVLPGFQWLETNAGVSVYGGPTVQDQSTDPYDPGKPRQGTRLGAKALAEGWWRPVDGVFLNASGSYATAAETYTARLAATVAITPRLSLEPEVAAFGEPGYDQQRFGVLIGYRPRPAFELKVGGGWALEPDGDGPYAAVQVKMWK